MSRYSPFIQYFKDRHQETIGHPYDVTWGKDNKIMQALQTTYGPQKLVKLIDAFFADFHKNDFLKQTGLTIGVFRTQIPKLLLKIKPDDEDVRKGVL